MPMFKNDNVVSYQIHEGFFFITYVLWALSLISTDQINLRNQHSIFFFQSDSVRHLLLGLLTGDTCSFNQAERASDKNRKSSLYFFFFTLKGFIS